MFLTIPIIITLAVHGYALATTLLVFREFMMTIICI